MDLNQKELNILKKFGKLTIDQQWNCLEYKKGIKKTDQFFNTVKNINQERISRMPIGCILIKDKQYVRLANGEFQDVREVPF